jgi:hypothetical protein
MEFDLMVALAENHTYGSNVGLCDTCEHQVEVRNTRGSVFSLCARSRTDPAYPRYPRLPVLECPGYEKSRSRDDWGD